MFFVYVCACGNVAIHISLKKQVTKTTCALCVKTTTRAVKRESSRTTCLYKGEDWESALIARREWIARRK